MRFLLLLTLLCACTTPRGGGDDDDSASDDDDAAATEPWVDDDSVIASLTHGGASPCPDPMGWITLVNPLADDIDFSVGQGPNINGASILAFSPAALGEGEEGNPTYLGTLPANSSFDVHVAFNCSDLTSSSTLIAGSLNLVGYEVEVAVDIP